MCWADGLHSSIFCVYAALEKPFMTFIFFTASNCVRKTEIHLDRSEQLSRRMRVSEMSSLMSTSQQAENSTTLQGHVVSKTTEYLDT